MYVNIIIGNDIKRKALVVDVVAKLTFYNINYYF